MTLGDSNLTTQNIHYTILEHDDYQYPPVCLWDNFKIVCNKVPSNWVFKYEEDINYGKEIHLSPNQWLDDSLWIYSFWDAYHRNGDGSFELEKLAHKVYEEELRIIWEECGKGWIPNPFE